jgi:hypothetical protein
MMKERQETRYRSSRVVGLMFLIPGLIWGAVALSTGTFAGAAMGFCTFAVLFGALMLLISRSADAS